MSSADNFGEKNTLFSIHKGIDKTKTGCVIFPRDVMSRTMTSIIVPL